MYVHPADLGLDRTVLLDFVCTVAERALDRLVQYIPK